MARKKPKPTPEYERWRAEWGRQRRARKAGDTASWLFDPAHLPADATSFVATLGALGFITQDPAFHAARSAIIEHDLVDGAGQWKRYLIFAHRDANMVCEEIAKGIAAGVPARQAFAEVAVTLNVEGASFEAAVLRVRRFYRAWRDSKSV